MFSNYFKNLLPLSFERRHAAVGETDSFLYRYSGAYGYNSSIGHDDFERKNMIGGRAVDWHVRAGRIVRNHTAERCARACCNIRTKTKPVRS